ncbi:hypothetical protein [Sphingobium baderi]|uniref:Uncharacterized protein n=1 Tax=Sphingobium baderi TaxID=1332080 RepID=A0A0S3F2F6_9SPHN|nr:hypothetical protein [Sphingobium baderi]ALR21876.1 hypothetical protein ATN00_17850 [Sphingobium baderi]
MDREVDVNYLLHRQQMSLIRAAKSQSAAGRTAYEDLARGYGERVDAYRQGNFRTTSLTH